MFLAIDIGNTNITVGLFEEDKIIKRWRFSTDYKKTSDEYGMMFENVLSSFLYTSPLKGVCISCVVPPLLPVFEEMIESFFSVKPLVVGPGVKTGIAIRYENPKEVGADRIANAVGGYYKYRCALIIVDFGTATTFDYVTKNGEYLGGAIFPGIGISSDALFEHTAKLPRVEFQKPNRVIGRNTVESIQSGLFYGYISLVDGMVEFMKKEGGEDPLVIGTGGYVEKLAPMSRTIKIVDKDITLYGLKFIFERNMKGVEKGKKSK